MTSLLPLLALGPLLAASPPTQLAAAGDAKVKVMVLEPSATTKDDRTIATVVAGLLPIELATVDALEVLSAADVKQMVELEAEKEAMGCSDNSCLAELAGALGADLVVFGDVSRLGALIIVNINLFDSVKARAAGRISIQTKDIESLPAELTAAVRKLVRPYLTSHGLAVPDAWADPPVTETVAQTEPASAAPETSAAQPPGVTTAAEPADGGIIFGVLPWAVGAGGAAVGAIGIVVAVACLALPIVGVPATVAFAQQTDSEPLYQVAGHLHNLLYVMFYGGTTLSMLIIAGGGVLTVAGVGWGTLNLLE
jgi:TolB-like protein